MSSQTGLRFERIIMPCAPFNNGILCYRPRYRLRLLDGRYVYMEWHAYLGPTLYHDRAMNRKKNGWWDDLVIIEALNWFQARGCRA